MRGGCILVVALAVYGSIGARAQAPAPASDPFAGTWKLNVARSTYRSGPPPAATTTDVRTFSAMDGGWHVFQLVGVTPEGVATMQVLAYRFDGQRYPVHNGTTLAALLATGKQTGITRSYRRVDANTVEFITYTDGVASPPARRIVSKDGKTYTQIIQAPNAKGELVENVSVFDRLR